MNSRTVDCRSSHRFDDVILRSSGKTMPFLQACSGLKMQKHIIELKEIDFQRSKVEWCEENAQGHWRFELHGVDRIIRASDGRQTYNRIYAVFYFQKKSDLILFKLSN